MEIYRRIKEWIHTFFGEGARKVLRLLSMWDKTFKQQYENAKPAEYLVRNCLTAYAYTAELTGLADQHKGDLLVHDELANDSFYAEIKKDTIIGKTGNVFVELEIQRGSGTAQGWYHYDYTNLAVVDATPANSRQKNKPIYFIDFYKMKSELDLDDKRCKRYQYRNEDGNKCTALLVPIRYIIARGWLKETFYYNADDWKQAQNDAKGKENET